MDMFYRIIGIVVIAVLFLIYTWMVSYMIHHAKLTAHKDILKSNKNNTDG